MIRLFSFVSGLLGREEGQTLTEYGLLLAFIAVVAMVTVGFLGDKVTALFQSMVDELAALV